MQTAINILMVVTCLAVLGPKVWPWVRAGVSRLGIVPQRIRDFGAGVLLGGVVMLALGGLAVWGLPAVKWPTFPVTVPPAPAPITPTRVAFFHESGQGQLPPYISGQEGAAGKLRAAGRVVWQGDIDIIDGTGDVPEWAKAAVEPAKKIISEGGKGSVAMVTLDGAAVVKAVRCPGSLEAILEAAK